jgi:hypothetical protein
MVRMEGYSKRVQSDMVCSNRSYETIFFGTSMRYTCVQNDVPRTTKHVMRQACAPSLCLGFLKDSPSVFVLRGVPLHKPIFGNVPVAMVRFAA